MSSSTVFVHARAHRFPVAPFPEIDLDVFKICIYKRWRLGEVLYVNLLIAFGTPSPPNSQHKLISGVLMAWHCRFSFLLDHFAEGQEISDKWISGHPEHLGHYPAGRDGIFHTYICQSIVVPDLLVFCPGRWCTIFQRMFRSSCACVQADIQLLPGM